MDEYVQKSVIEIEWRSTFFSWKSFDPQILKSLAQELKEVHELGVDLAIVVGGGNFIRGKMAETMGIERVQADYMGMLATVINALAVQSALEQEGVPTRVQTAIEMQKVAEHLSFVEQFVI